MRILGVVFLAVAAHCVAAGCPVRRAGSSKLLCYYGKLTDVDGCYCTHAVLPADADVKAVERARQRLGAVKILVTVNEFNQGLIDLLKNSKVDGLEINLKKLDSKNDISDFISTVRSKLGSDLYLALSVPSKADILAKYYDFKSLSKHTDLFVLQTAFLGASKNVTFHPSRLSGMWDMQNTDSVVDLVNGLGAPLSKVVITAPVQAFQFTLQDEEYTAPGSPALEVKSLTRNELCNMMNEGRNWTLERDEDQAGPYIFSKNQWIAFEDATSMDIKAKYSRVRGLAGMALKDVSQDNGDKCGPSILEAAYNGLSRQARAPRGAVLHSLEREIREASQPLHQIQVSPFRISRIIDVEGKIHAVRQDTRTEFQCSRQGYFVHPRSCNRFYRCVKFDQLVDDFNVFEFDCPAGLAFDERVEVCVWPGSLPHGTPCAGSSEIAPVPRQRFDCPAEQGYYADPENCRWFFACLDHGKSPLTAYEFRCPFGLVFDSERLLCEWPWLVPKCGSGLGVNLASEYAYGGYYSGHGAGVVLEQYDGLGALGTVKLGGLAGGLQQPLVYSNVGTAGLGYNSNGYVNQGGYIVGNGLGGLGYKATQSLQNAGLLRTDLGAGAAVGAGYNQGSTYLSGTGAVGVGYNQGSTYLGSTGAVGVGYNQGSSYVSGTGASSAGLGISNQYQYNSGADAQLNLAGNFGTKLSNADALNTQYVSGANLGYATNSGTGAFGLKTQNGLQYQSGDLSTNQYQAGQNLGTINTGYAQGELNTVQVQGNLGSGLEHSTATGNNLGAISSQSFTQYHSGANSGSGLDNSGGSVVVGTSDLNQGYNSVQYQAGTGSGLGFDAFGAKINQAGQAIDYGNAFGAKSQSFAQYQGSTGQGVAGNINIVGGGYSAVAESKSGIEINGESINNVYQSTPSPASVTTFASVPTVTSVPIPALKTAAGFESYKGGVVANVPELQYKIQDSTDLANISASFVKFVSTTPTPLLVSEGYDYQRPATYFSGSTGQNNVQSSGAGATSYSYQSLDSSLDKGSYVYTNPSSVQGVTISGYGGSSTARPEVTVVQQNAIPAVSIQKNEGYVYSKPSIAFEEGPAKTVSSFSISSTPTPVTVVQQQVQPVATYERQDFVAGGYKYEQPAIAFGVKQQSTPQVYVSSTAAPIVEQKVQVQPAVSSYSFTQNVASQGYDYPKPSIAFEERPVVQTYQQVKPAVVSKFSIRKPTVQPAIVNTYVQQPVVVQPTGSSYSYQQDYQSGGYQYQKPSIAFEEAPQPVQPVQPAVVSTYHYQQPTVRYGAVQPTYTYQKPAVTSYNYQDIAQKAVGVYQNNAVSTYNYATSTARPAVVSSYSYTPSTTSAPAVAVQNVQFGGYDYPKPSVTFSEEPTPVVTTYQERQPVQEVPFVKKKAYVTGQGKSYQYSQRFETPAAPVVVENYQVKASIAPVVQNYVSSTPSVPVVVENYQAPVKTYSQSVDTSNAYFYNNVNTVSSTPVYQQEYYSTPTYQADVQQLSTPRPTLKSVLLTAKVRPTTEAPNFYYYDSRLSSTAKTTVDGGYIYSKPKIQFEERPVQRVATTTYLPPTKEYLPSKPISSYSFSSLDTQYQTLSTPRPFSVSTTPLTREYIPVTTKVQVTTPQPQSVFVVPEVSTYVPVRSKIRYTTSRPIELTTPEREYLPVSITTASPSLSTVEVSSRAPVVTTPSRDYLPVRSRVRVTTTGTPLVNAGRPAKVTIIKQNDLHPMLAAKLGAQCTCVSNTLNLRKKQKIIIVEDDDDDDDGYVVANEGGKVVENYQYNAQDTVEITPTPQLYLPSTSETLAAPSPTYAVRKRVRVRPLKSQPVTEAVEVFLKNDVTPIGVSDGEIASAVRTGLKLVKQAAKEGAEEALNSRGRAGVRDTIDCQRAGLFRHPNQCNKFYACRWDCTKNKFTLHTFNCPVHLTFDNSLGACNWPSQGPACLENTLLPSE